MSIDTTKTETEEIITEHSSIHYSNFLHTILENRHGIQSVLAGFLCNFMVFGAGFSYGVFQEFYGSVQGPLYGKSESMIALIGTVSTALTYICGIFNKSLMFYMCPRNVMLIGCLASSLGMILTGFANEYYQFILCSILQGVGGGIVYLPPVVCGPVFFDKHRSLASGVLFSGTGVGAFALATFTRYLIEQVGWRWSVRVLGLMTFVITGMASFLVVEPKIKGFRSNNSLINFSQLKSGKVGLQLLGSLLQSAGYLMPLIFMSKYAVSLGFTSSQGALFIGVSNIVNAGSKVFTGIIADKLGRMNTLMICSIISAIAIFSLWLPGSRQTFLSLIFIYGIFSGAIISLLPPCLIELFGIASYTQLSGIMYCARGIGVVIGSPIGALLINNSGQHPRDYIDAIVYNGVLLTGSCLCLGYLWVLAFKDRVPRSWKL
ncbi:Monocarboxylate transporter 13 [Spathaspora sp. JA1]|nr:Monocarboxylate transporter 13 [Spathaspora sp. JA1]